MNAQQARYDKKVTRLHIEEAIRSLKGYRADEGYEKTRRSTIYCLEVKGTPRHLPPKVVITRSAVYVLGKELAAGKFNGGVRYANGVLERLGFGDQIRICGTRNCGGHGKQQ